MGTRYTQLQAEERMTLASLRQQGWSLRAIGQCMGRSAIASSQAQMIDRPALSYGMFHAQVRPNKLYGIVTTGISFQGLNMDIGHLRHIRWVKDDDPQSAVNNKPELTQNGKTAAQNRWIVRTTRCAGSTPARWNTPCPSNSG